MVKIYKVFTDGSSTTMLDSNGLKYGGIGIFLSKYSKFNRSISFKNNIITNQKCELMACIEAITILSNTKKKNVEIIIYTDSMYTIKCATEWSKKWITYGWRRKVGNKFKEIINLDLIKKLYNLVNKNNIKFIHVRSHQKEPHDKQSNEWFMWHGNKMADELAFNAMKKARK
jgi:ribonuclease HI